MDDALPSRLDIDEAIKAVLDVRSYLTGDPDADDELTLDMIEGQTDALEMLSALIIARRQADEQVKAMERLSEHYGKRAAAAKKASEAIKSRIGRLADATGLPQIQRPEGLIHRSRRGPGARVYDETQLPDAFVKRAPRLDAIRKALLAGEDVPGASLGNGSEFWVIR